MKGLTLIQFIDMMNFIQIYHSFARYYNNNEEEIIKKEYPNLVHLGIKYTDSVHDTRSNTIWNVTFRRGRMKFNFTTSNLSTDPNSNYNKYDDFFELIMDFLKGNITDVKEFIVKENI
jgi:hypothetical protein